ncbi:MAG: T9SS type A sorting domain-containing protein [Bacteroidota bacterium]
MYKILLYTSSSKCPRFPTHHGGYILGGYSYSGIGGEKTQVNWDPSGNTPDYWIVKIDSIGNKQWDKDFGGTNFDIFQSLEQTRDGGYILGGDSKSGINGNKTTPLWGGLNYDYWIIKTDSLGNKQWEKDLGGINNDVFDVLHQTIDGGYLIGGASYSNISGDKTESNLGSEQGWIVKTDSLGTKQWDKTIFTINPIRFCSAIETIEGSYAFASYDNSAIGGYKTQASWGGWDYWIINFRDTTSVEAKFKAADSTVCSGSCVSYNNVSTSSISYQWSFPGAIPDTSTVENPSNICYSNAGSYDVQLIATNANGSDTLLLSNYITVFPSPPPQAITQSGDTLFANAGATSYQWYINGNLITGATQFYYVAPASGDYNVVATDGNGCEVEAAVFNVLAEVGSGSQQPIEIYPNPVDKEFTMRNSQFTIGTAVNISIYNLVGVKIFSAVDCRLPTIDCRLLPPGLYFLEVSHVDKMYRAKFVKQ